jgi:hypothetical protein
MTMRCAFPLLVVVAKAASIISVACFAVALVASRVVPTAADAEMVGTTLIILATGAAAFWVFRNLQARYSRRQARSVAIAFGICTPVSLLAALLIGQLLGGLTGTYFGDQFSFVGAFVGTVAISAAVSLVPTTLVLWIVCRDESHEGEAA